MRKTVKATPEERMNLISDVGKKMEAATESFDWIGSTLAYLLWAISDGAHISLFEGMKKFHCSEARSHRSIRFGSTSRS